MTTTIAPLQQNLRDTQVRAKALLDRTIAQCSTEGRLMSPTEKQAIQTLLDEGKTLKAQLDRAGWNADFTAEFARLSEGMTPSSWAGGRRGSTWGELFAHHPEVRQFIERGDHRRLNQSCAPVLDMSSTLLTEGAGSGGALVRPDYPFSTVVPLAQPPAVVAALFASGPTDSNTVLFQRVKTFTNAAAPVAEGTAKPESTVIYESVTTPVVKFAHWIPVTHELFEDVAGMASAINGHLRRGLEQKIDNALLNGTGVAPDLPGILTRPGLAPDHARGTDTNIDAIKKAISKITAATSLQVSAVILNPVNFDTVTMAKNAEGTTCSPRWRGCGSSGAWSRLSRRRPPSRASR